MEVARGTTIACSPLEAHPAPALARVRVTEAIGHSRAGALACFREGGRDTHGQCSVNTGHLKDGWGSCTHADSQGHRTQARRARSGRPGSWVCTHSVPPAGPSGRRCPESLQRCSHSLQEGGGGGSDTLQTRVLLAWKTSLLLFVLTLFSKSTFISVY